MVNLRDDFSYNGATNYNLGQDVGDATAIVVGTVEMVFGTKTAAGGTTGFAISCGAAVSGVRVPIAAGGEVVSGGAVVGGTALAAHDAVMAGNGTANLGTQKRRVNIKRN